jgi:type I restriction enzyme M protein
MTDIVGKIWGFCNTLRHDGINYGDYIEQLTYLLFLKLADENGLEIPNGCSWSDLRAHSGTDLSDYYNSMLRTLSKQEGILGDIYASSRSKFRQSANLKQLINLIDETQWTTLKVDIKAQTYEGLLEKYAAEQKGAGQYFTPRPAIKTVVRCTKPDIREHSEFTIHDPACGTAGFLIEAYEWMMKISKEGTLLKQKERERLQKETFSGCEIVLETRRLALMNLYLHKIKAEIYWGDALSEGPHTGKKYDCIMTNPPFGAKGASKKPSREDFTVKTSNKQLNFLQHVMATLKLGGRAAIVLPDNVLFEEHAGREVRKLLLTDCDLHTILRLPIGTFAPYSPGVKANILFFRKGLPTEEVWVYDLRTNVDKITKGHPLTDEYFRDFEVCYAKPRLETERFKRFTRKYIEDRDYDLDIFCLKGESLEKARNLPEPEDLVSEALTTSEVASNCLHQLLLILQNSEKGTTGA